MPNLVSGTYPAFMKGYLHLVDADSVQQAIEKYADSILVFFKNIPQQKINYRYEAGKWNIKEMLQHIIDTERIFSYRALRIARHDKTPLPGFEEKSFAAAANTNERSWNDLLREFEAVRTSTNYLLKSFTPDQLTQTGTTNNEPNTTEAICYVIFGHILHHINILKERYL